MSDFKPLPRKKNALDNRKLNLSTPCPTAKGKYSALIWGVYSNNPRLTVYTGDPDDTTKDPYGRITAALDVPTFFAFLELMKRVIVSKEEVKFSIENKNFTFFGGKRSEKPVLVSTLWVGKDKDGKVWISVISDDASRPKVRFFFGDNQFHHITHSDGSPLTPGENSTLFATGYFSILTNLVSDILVKEYVEDKPKQPQQGGQGGYNNQNQGGGGQNNYRPQANSASKFEDEIPF